MQIPWWAYGQSLKCVWSKTVSEFCRATAKLFPLNLVSTSTFRRSFYFLKSLSSDWKFTSNALLLSVICVTPKFRVESVPKLHNDNIQNLIIALFSAHNRQMLCLWKFYVTYMTVQLILFNSPLQDHFKKINGTSVSLFESHLAEIVWRNHHKGNILRPYFNMIQRAFPCDRPPLGRVIPVPLFDSWNVTNQTEYEEKNSILRIDDDEEVFPCQSEETDTPSPQQIDPDTPVISPPFNRHWRPTPPVANNSRRQTSPVPIRHGVMAAHANDDITGYESPPHHRPSPSRPVRVVTSMPFPAIRQEVAVLVHYAQQGSSPQPTPPAPTSVTVDNVTPEQSPNAASPTQFVLETLPRNVTVRRKRKLNSGTRQQQSANGGAPTNFILETVHKNVTVRKRKPPTGSKHKRVISKKTVSKNKKTRVLLPKPFDGSEDSDFQWASLNDYILVTGLKPAACIFGDE